MGLGDTLGALPPENGGTGSTTAQGILEKAYPVGSVYMSLNNTDPGTLFGGTWAPIRDRFLVGAGGSYAAKATGGEAAHKLTVAEMPSHGHKLTVIKRMKEQYVDGTNLGFFLSTGTGGFAKDNPGRYVDSYLLTAQTDSSGSGTAHNNMPPYYAVYMWARTA